MATHVTLREFPYDVPRCEIQEMRHGFNDYQFRTALYKYGWLFDIDLMYVDEEGIPQVSILTLQGCELQEINLDIAANQDSIYATYIITISRIIDRGIPIETTDEEEE
jgi:hypothetical protein